ncbi:MAG: hypothetical protein ACE5EV_08765, partial [Gaiellales bacterium]
MSEPVDSTVVPGAESAEPAGAGAPGSQRPAGPAILVFENVTKVYDGNVVALDRVGFGIEPGEFTFLVGASGSGTST